VSTQDKAIAWILVLQGLAGSATLIYTSLVSTPSIGAIILLAPLSLLSIGAGIGILRSERWGYILGISVLLDQIPAIQTPWFHYFVWLGLQLKIFMGSVGAWQIGVNLLALALFGWVSYRYNAPNNSFKPKPLRGSA
jgi:hypothetical protein